MAGLHIGKIIGTALTIVSWLFVSLGAEPLQPSLQTESVDRSLSADDATCGALNYNSGFCRPGQIIPSVIRIVDGKVYVGGSTIMPGVNGAATTIWGVFVWDGSHWSFPTYDQGLEPRAGTDLIKSIEVVGSDIYVGGTFNGTIGGNSPGIRNIARWDGQSWHTLGSGLNSSVWTIAAADTGTTIFVGGEFTKSDTTTLNRLAQWDGSSWLPLLQSGGSVPGTNNRVNDLAVRGDTVFCCGLFTTVGDGLRARYVARWSRTTQTWAEIGGGTSSYTYHLVIHDSDMYISGAFTLVGSGDSVRNVARWDGHGWHDVGLNGAFKVDDIAVSDSGLLYFCGDFGLGVNSAMRYVGQWNGTTWSPINSVCNSDQPVTRVETGGNDIYIIGGGGTCTGLTGGLAHSNGERWVGLGNGVSSSTADLFAILIDHDTVYACGKFEQAGGEQRDFSLSQWYDNGWHRVRAGSFSGIGPNTFQYPVYAMDKYGGKLYAGGNFTQTGGHTVYSIAAWDGSDWSGLGGDNTGFNGATVRAMAEFNNDLYIGGDFTSAETPGGPLDVSGLVRWNGTSWQSIIADQGFNGVGGSVFALAPDGNVLYTGGRFSRSDAVPSANIAVWDGIAWHGLGSGVGGSVPAGTVVQVNSIAVSGPDLFAGGNFSNAINFDSSVVQVHNLARWDGQHWHASGNFNGAINAIYARGGELYAAGAFTLVDAVPANHLARWDGDQWNAVGDGTRGLETGSTGVLYCLTPDDSGMWMGGRFTHAGSLPISNITHWNFCTVSPPLAGEDTAFVNGTEVTVDWQAPTAGKSSLRPRAVTFQVQVGNGTDFEVIAADLSNIIDTFITISGLEQNTFYSWRVRAVIDGTAGAWSERSTFTTGIATDITDPSEILPKVFSLSQNYPNPFNPSTTIRFTLPRQTFVRLEIFNVLGQKVTTQVDQLMPAGDYTISWDGTDNAGRPVSSGVYLYRITAGEFVDTRKMLLLK